MALLTLLLALATVPVAAPVPDRVPDEAKLLDAVVVVGSRSPEPVRQVVGTVSRIDRRAMDRQGVRDIQDLARLVPGLDVAVDANRFGALGFNLRGLDGNRVSVEIDGIPLSDTFAVGQFALAGRDLVELGAVDRVEILRGPASTLYGSKALAGVVAFWTPDPAELQWDEDAPGWQGEARLGLGSRDEAAWASTRLATRSDDGRVFSLLSLGRRQGHEAGNRARSAGDAANPADTRNDVLLAKTVVDAAAARWTATIEHTQGRRHTDVQSLLFGPGRFSTTYALTGDDSQQRDRASLQAEWAEAGALGPVRALVYWQDSEVEQLSDQYRLADRATPFASHRGRAFHFDQQSVGLEISGQWRGEWAGLEHWQVFGIDLVRHDYRGRRDGFETNLATGATTNVVLGEVLPVRDFPNSRATELGLFWQDEIRLAGGWALVPGLRWESYRLRARADALWAADNPGDVPVSLDNQSFTPKLGLRWSGDALSVYLQYVRGFRAPPFADANIGLYLPAFNYVALPNPDLRPERSQGFEAGLRWSSRDLALSLAVYDNRFTDLIDSRANLGTNAEGQLVFQSVNRARARIHGVELEARWQAGGAFPAVEGWYVDAIASWSRGEDSGRGVPLNSVPPPRATLAAGFESADGRWGAELRLTGVGAVSRADQGAGALFLPPGYATVDAHAWLVLRQRLHLNLSLANLGDRRYWDWSTLRGLPASAGDIDFYSRPGRSASLGLRYEF